jgi:signal transduction histidine kinase
MAKTQLSTLLEKLCWVIPGLMAAFGAGYILFEHFLIIPNRIAPIHIFRQVIIISTLGPGLAWLLLTWATGIARSREQAVKSLERRALQLEIASQVGQKVTAILEVDELLAEVVRLIRSKFGYYQVHIFLADTHSNEIVLRECNGRVDESLMTRGLRLKIGKESITGWVAETGQPVLCNDVTQEARYHPHELLPETHAELAIPLKIGNKVVGVLDVQSEHPYAFREDDLTVLQLLGDQIAIALENAKLFRETRRQFEAMRALHDISLDITSRLESEQVLTVILKQADHLLSAQGSVLAIYKPEVNMVRNVAVYNILPEYEGVMLQLGEGAVGHVVATGEPLIVNDYRHWPGRSSIFRNSPYDAILGVPLQWEGQVFGALSVLDHGERRPFTEDDIRLLSLFADLASIALKNAELYTQVVQLGQQLEQKVEQRTNELVKTQEELARKAEQLQRLLAATVRIQEEERTRIAQDLHDGSNQLITGTLYEIQAAQEGIQNRRQGTVLAKLKTAKELLRQIETENRRIISGLRPLNLDVQGLVPALKQYVNTFREHCLEGVNCSIQVLGRPCRLSPEAEIAVYRIVQEALNNVAAHAQARNVCIQINFKPTWLHLVVDDDGVGFDHKSMLATAPGQMGLIGMRERAQSIGGQIEIQSNPGRGSQIRLDVPLSTSSTSQARSTTTAQITAD